MSRVYLSAFSGGVSMTNVLGQILEYEVQDTSGPDDLHLPRWKRQNFQRRHLGGRGYTKSANYAKKAQKKKAAKQARKAQRK